MQHLVGKARSGAIDGVDDVTNQLVAWAHGLGNLEAAGHAWRWCGHCLRRRRLHGQRDGCVDIGMLLARIRCCCCILRHCMASLLGNASTTGADATQLRLRAVARCAPALAANVHGAAHLCCTGRRAVLVFGSAHAEPHRAAERAGILGGSRAAQRVLNSAWAQRRPGPPMA